MRGVLQALLFAMLTACAGTESLGRLGVEITDTGIEVGRSSGAFIAAWKDERTLVFSEVIDPSWYVKYGESRFPGESLQIVFYNVISKKKEVYRPGRLACFRNGRIAYYLRIPDPAKSGELKQVLYVGELGKEQLIQKTMEIRLNEFDCDMREVVPGRTYGYLMEYLKREDGYIDGGKAFPGELQYRTPAVWYGFMWRGISRSEHDRDLGIAGLEVLVFDLSNNELMAVRRNFLRVSISSRGLRVNWQIGKKCMEVKEDLHAKVLKPINPYVNIRVEKIQ